jgi:hypothetical protein
MALSDHPGIDVFTVKINLAYGATVTIRIDHRHLDHLSKYPIRQCLLRLLVMAYFHLFMQKTRV